MKHILMRIERGRIEALWTEQKDRYERTDERSGGTMEELKQESYNIVKKITDSRSYYIELMACAFVKQVGEDSVLSYELVEQRSEDGTQITWFFRKK